eukprot:5716551-Pyramimonas_sp.AAC.1
MGGCLRGGFSASTGGGSVVANAALKPNRYLNFFFSSRTSASLWGYSACVPTRARSRPTFAHLDPNAGGLLHTP